MNKLIELSIRGSRYYLIANIDGRKMEELEKFATQFYSQNLWCKAASDHEIAKGFFAAVKTNIDMNIDPIRVDSVLTIK